MRISIFLKIIRVICVFFTLSVSRLSAGETHGLNWEDRHLFEKGPVTHSITVLSSTDTSYFAPLIEDFLTRNPGVSLEYIVASTAQLEQIFRQDPAAYDVVISSAMDLQFKLANDGFARQLESISAPDHNHWRKSLFAFTFEPAAIVIRKAAFEGHPIPSTRQELIEALRNRPTIFEGRVGTYDVRQSGLGYLFATQDARVSDTFWRLTEVMGSLNAQLYCCSGEMITDLVEGRLLVAYNVLGSYAQAQIAEHDDLQIILPSDYTTSMMRTALVSQFSQNHTLATAFLKHLVYDQFQSDMGTSPLNVTGFNTDMRENVTISLDPALMTYLDSLKRRTFLAEWESAIIQKE